MCFVWQEKTRPLSSLLMVGIFMSFILMKYLPEPCRRCCPFAEVDAIATKRFDAQTGADREVQRILLELLNQVPSFFCVLSVC